MASQRSREAAMLFLSLLVTAVKHVCGERRVAGSQSPELWWRWQPGVELLEAAVGSVGGVRAREACLQSVCTSLSVSCDNELENRRISFQ